MAPRKATHAGSWYYGDRNKLIKALLEWFSGTVELPNAKYIVAPHAGYLYCASTATHSYRSLPSSVRRVFVLGPDHTGVSTGGIAHLSPFDSFETPLGALSIDKTAVNELLHSGKDFTMGNEAEDMEEHSLELMMPFIAYRTELKATVVPMVISRGDIKALSRVANAIKSIMKEDDFLVISSDFCHYGTRFGFAPSFGKAAGEDITKNIESMDRKAVEAMSTSTVALAKYFDETHNTICGHYPLLIATLIYPPDEYEPKIVMYSNSSPRLTTKDSGVSYCAVVGVKK